ncbi:beta-ketoacyl synthase chain length factor [Roseomonas sp. BN140053]|uniref:beta-ketoacyl synthase chain length factor n=1 Tax=Roseomonas sp. BN140053 TaxID=3391898 RepID=UPI0039E8C5DA
MAEPRPGPGGDPTEKGVLRCWVSGIGLLGPGLPGWEGSEAVLAGREAWQDAPLAVPPPALLAPTERRRTSPAVRLALAAAGAATADSGLDPASLDSVFASSNGDGAVVGAILDALATPDGVVSPTQFHNSVHNAAAGYWGIGTGSTRPSVSLGCHDDTFAAGLLQAAVQVATRGVPVLLCAYDAPLAPPLDAVRPTAVSFAVALVLVPQPDAGSRAALRLRYATAAPAVDAPPPGSASRALAAGNPAARALPLLEAIAARRAAALAIPLLDDAWLAVEVTPC